ncbi:MAG: glycosyltransferase family 4 protein [Elusimicrobia bacterium]|nr:glycosyltransferase family 4 protein [Elusimicrobiota bacterium]
MTPRSAGKSRTRSPSSPSTASSRSSKAIRVALAGFKLSDPTDRAIARGLARALRARGHRVDVFETVPPFRRHDLWHCHVFGRSQAALAKAAARAKTPVVATLHLVLPDYLPHARGLRGLLGLARRVSAVSEASLAQARASFPAIARKSSVVGYGISPAPGRGAAPKNPYALCASRLAPYKGVDVLLMAYARARDAGARFELLLCGRDQLGGGLRRFAETLGLGGGVRFAGEVAPSRLRRLLERSLFFALPSRRENSPLAVLEALDAGKPIVASRTGGVPELLNGGRAGLLVPPGDVEALARAMTRLAADAALRRRLGAAARARARTYTWPAVARRFEELYALALG